MPFAAILFKCVIFLNSEAFRRYFLSAYELEEEKKSGKYEEHKQKCRCQGRIREVHTVSLDFLLNFFFACTVFTLSSYPELNPLFTVE